MITSVSVRGFQAIPYLESSKIMQTNKGVVKFSKTKVNVIVGPNGSGKTALLDALSLRLLANLTGESALNDGYIFDRGEDKGLWSERDWRKFEFLPGLHVETDNGPAVYYRPRNIPGGESSVVSAMMMGYEAEARTYAAMTSKRSSGEAGVALLAHALESLDAGAGAPKRYGMTNWRFGTVARDLSKTQASDYDYKAETLRRLADQGKYKVPVVLMDEPEQSLDARAQGMLWEKLRNVSDQVQVIVATHSLHPLMHRDRFHFIECERGYMRDLVDLAGHEKH